ncbi:type II toxin-antitoxin system PemK/MazF family toxin [Megasphaera vaginalis (ex Bordigoni et al. 2020)]|uniref:type II toxin-antitoxin system PemK/MazF family toxin n=1 Tax=Megasphaera vaginalis (ex Bordigoni et al. 2020) TaxID=2045301 RepID=UPI0013562F1F|nr:type II toxin-antitoxin system PemK/MazF family toxin [Megasphaera vaginalis (ex Bordigoni et al. 2020)]
MGDNNKTRKKTDLKNIQNKPILLANIATLSCNQRQYLTDETELDYHRAAVLYYGLSEQLSKLKNEKKFHQMNNQRFISLKRGSIIKIDFGLPLGSEFGGLHYAIVLHSSNTFNPLVSVLPIKSYKDNNYYKTDILFDDEIYQAIRSHLLVAKSIRRHRIKTFKTLLRDHNKRIESLFTQAAKEGFSLKKDSFDLLGAIFHGSATLKTALQESRNIPDDELKKMQDRILRNMNNVKVIAGESKKFKKQSIGITSQIRTLSKIRIKFPLNRFDPLYNIRVDSKTLDKISQALHNYYL